MDPFRVKLLSLSNEITDRELVELKFICKQHIPVGVLEKIKRPLELFDELENRNLLTSDNKEFLAAILGGINRLELRNDLLGQAREDHSSPLNVIQETLFDLYKDVIGWLQPLAWNKSFHIHIKHIYTNLQMITRTQHGRRTKREPLESYFEIFQPRSPSSKQRRILIEGQAGVGKSTFASLMVYDWACGNTNLQHFKLVLFMELKQMKGNLKSDIFELLFPKDFYYSADFLFQYIVANQENVLFILDGYDEVNPSQLKDAEDLIMGKICRNATVVVTSRPGKGSRVHWFMDSRIEITGFTNENIHEFVLKYFQDDVSMAESLITQLEMHPVAENIARIPLTAMLICAMWEEMPQASVLSSMTYLFIELTLLLVKRYYARQPDENSFVPENISSLEDIPDDLFQSLLSLGEISLNGLLNDQLLFDLCELEKKCTNKGALDVGFLSKELGASRLKPVQKCRFSHRSYQEFLAALWLSHKIKQAFSDRSVFDHVSVYIMNCLSSGLNSVLFLFTPGLLGDSFQPFLELLLQEGAAEVEEDESLRQSFFEVCFLSLYESNQGHLAYKLGSQMPPGVVTLHHFNAAPYRLRALVYFLLNNPSVTSLVIEHSQVGKQALQVLARFLPEMISIQGVHLQSNMITDESFSAFAKSLSSVPHLEKLVLADNLMTEHGLGFLISAFKDLPNLRQLDIQGNKISGAGFGTLAPALSHLPKLEELWLGSPVVSGKEEGQAGGESHSPKDGNVSIALSETAFNLLMEAANSHDTLKTINLSPYAVPVGQDPAKFDKLKVS
ncbi:hypothetical protein ACROYT_G012579 [Oculina patagonica]